MASSLNIYVCTGFCIYVHTGGSKQENLKFFKICNVLSADMILQVGNTHLILYDGQQSKH